ncbi:DUF6869 domain-containing protein [Caulobacter sp. 17J65-9]|uniref:DUF6869 domain-containing protein n=1 Tax=Caulobacter sp. 17J65-9 TaxID=2709382 RepID=UPI0013CD0DA6|nr:hypothetical protein [Caulobacter sp. 17J65-9]NEX92529.1 hypothetical protein [Caulobacter sp. 17J65-9]
MSKKLADPSTQIEDVEQLRRWLHAYVGMPRSTEGTPDGDAQLEAGWAVGDAARDDPELGWRLVKFACNEPLSDEDFAYLSAGVFEELMGAYGAQFIDRVEVFARQNARMRFVVATVWRGAMSEAVWDRILALRERLGIAPQ